jgi:hypothetical protein
MRRQSRSLAITAAAALLVLAPTAVAATTPVQNGCPAAAELTSVAQLQASGPYQLPSILDDPANGGNGDGWICAFPLPEAVQAGGEFTVYQFFENNLKAEDRP